MVDLIIDASNLINRNYFIYKSKEGEVNFYDFFFQSVKKLTKEYDVKNVYLVWDRKLAPDKPNFRKALSKDQYKANRNRDHYTDMMTFIPGIEKIADSLGFKNMYPYSAEADDVIAWLSMNLSGKNVIASSDKDLCQLISGKTVYYNLQKREEINTRNFEKILGVQQNCFVMKKAIMGDSSDNIVGIPGYGEVKSTKLAIELINDTTKMKDFKHLELLKENIKLMSLHYALKLLPEDASAYQEQLNLKPISNYTNFLKLCKNYGASYLTNKSEEFINIVGEVEDRESDIEDILSDLRDVDQDDGEC